MAVIIRTSDGQRYEYAGSHAPAMLLELFIRGEGDFANAWIRVKGPTNETGFVQVSQITLIAESTFEPPVT